ncbi:50S ribosomal protein L4, partial [Vibrio parahaemolyticus EKP-021]
SRLTKL